MTIGVQWLHIIDIKNDLKKCFTNSFFLSFFFKKYDILPLTLTLFNKIVFPFISGDKLIYYTK